MPDLQRQHLPQTIGKYTVSFDEGLHDYVRALKATTSGVAGFQKEFALYLPEDELSRIPGFHTDLLAKTKLYNQLSHPNLHQVFDLAKDENLQRYYLVTDHTSGHSLRTLIDTAKEVRRPLPLDLAIYIAFEVAKGLHYIHQRRGAEFEALDLCHGHLSPESIQIGFDGHIKITQPAIGCTTLEALLRADMWEKETIAYAAPEVISNKKASQAGDLYAFGLILYELISGEYPFRGMYGSSRDGFLNTVMHPKVPPLVHIRNLPPEISALVYELTQVIPEERPEEGTNQILNDLINFIYSGSIRVDSRHLSRFLDEIGIGRTNISPEQEASEELAMLALQQSVASAGQWTIRTQHAYRKDNAQLPTWIKSSISKLMRRNREAETYLFTGAIVLDIPDSFHNYATDHWARICEQISYEGEQADIGDTICIQTSYSPKSIFAPGIELCDQFFYQIAVRINAIKGYPRKQEHGFKGRLFALDTLLDCGLDPELYEKFKGLWIEGTPHSSIPTTLLAKTTAEVVCWAAEQLTLYSGKRGIIWFLSGIEYVDIFSGIVFFILMDTPISVPTVTVIQTTDEEYLKEKLLKRYNFSNSFHTITIKYDTPGTEIVEFEDLDEISQDIVLLLHTWSAPMSFDDLLDTTQLPAEMLAKHLYYLHDINWLRHLTEMRWQIMPHVQISRHLNRELSARRKTITEILYLRFKDTIERPPGTPETWRPTSIAWLQLNAYLKRYQEVVATTEYISASLEYFSLYNVMGDFYQLVDKTIHDANLHIPKFRNMILIAGVRANLITFELTKAQEFLRFLKNQANLNEPLLEAKISLAQAVIDYFMDNSKEACEVLQESTILAESIDNVRGVIVAEAFAAMSYARLGDYKSARELEARASTLVMTRDQNDFLPEQIATTFAYGTIVRASVGEIGPLKELLGAFVAYAQKASSSVVLVYLNLAIGFKHLSCGEYEDGVRALTRCAMLARPMQLNIVAIIAYFGLAHISYLAQDFKQTLVQLTAISIIVEKFPDSYYKLLEIDYRILTQLRSNEDDVDMEMMKLALQANYRRALNRGIEVDIRRIRYIAQFAPRDWFDADLFEIELPVIQTPIDLIRLFPI